jgi:hypothetical protein
MDAGTGTARAGDGAAKARGTIIKPPDQTPGLLFVNGQQKSFTLEGVWKSPVAPTANMTVEVELDASGNVSAVSALDAKQLNQERMHQLGNVAQEQGKHAAKLAEQGVSAMAARMGKLALGAGVFVWIAWFFFPAASLAGGLIPGSSYTFWDLLGIDFSNPLTLAGAGSSHGAFAFLGILCIAAPFAAPFIKAPWAKYLNAAPIAFIVIASLMIYMNQSKAFGDLAKLGGANPFSFSWGFYLLVLGAIVLGTGALKKPAA